MRRVMLGMLLAAGAALPTLAVAATVAAPQDNPPEARERRGPGGERPHDGGARPDQPRPQAQPQAQAPQSPPQAQVQAQARVDGRGDGGRFRGEGGFRGDNGARFGGDRRPFADRQDGGRPDRAAIDPGRQAQAQDQGQAQAQPRFRAPQDGVGQRSRYRGAYGDGRAPQPGYRGPQGGGYVPQRSQEFGRGPAPQYRPAPGTQGQYRAGGNWSRGWRTDQRFDWGRYRAENHYAFHLPRYYAPRGWGYGYRRFSPGLTLSSALFDEGFWIDEPYAYRLPPAYGPYRWVRYYNDALLVDVRSGYVVDTVYDIFW